MPTASGFALAVATAGYQGDILRLIADSGALVKCVLLILLGFSVLSWAVILERHRALRRAETDTVRFLQALEHEKRLADLRERSGRSRASPPLAVFNGGFREVPAALAEGVSRFRGGAARARGCV